MYDALHCLMPAACGGGVASNKRRASTRSHSKICPLLDIETGAIPHPTEFVFEKLPLKESTGVRYKISKLTRVPGEKLSKSDSISRFQYRFQRRWIGDWCTKWRNENDDRNVSKKGARLPSQVLYSTTFVCDRGAKWGQVRGVDQIGRY
jgi:hypothetical protein